MPIPANLLDLIDRFQQEIKAYKSDVYNETQTRQEFIDPLFETLGWDVGNRQGAGIAYREVVLEYSMKIGAPDYLFRVGNANRFFVEAKKPSVNILYGMDPAHQVRRYGWTAGLPLCILTDFESFVIYDTRVEPNKKDKADVARYQSYSYQEYGEKWDEIAELFHRDAVLGGSLEKFAQEQKAPRGSRPVDKAFLASIDAWRALLAKNIIIWNPQLTQRELNYAVQMTLDRLIFLRISEDRGIEPYEKLKRLLDKPSDYYKLLLDQFKEADVRYNSGLFHFGTEKGREAPDTLTPNIYIDDDTLKSILTGLYYPDSPYEFSVLPVEILGNTYEQFLGKIITIGANYKVEVEEKPEVRKAGGVYYTPSYVVDYIVKNTVGKLLEGKTPKEADKLRIVDPSCGSGSFLIGAYQYLLNWHRDWYIEHGTAKQKRDILYQGAMGDWRLTTGARKSILLHNIYGVDIDAQAVEVTKLSLCLKMLEGETEQSLGTTRYMFQEPERVLPDLSNNIKCGNSLIGPDFYDSQIAQKLSEKEQYDINPFDWRNKDGFAEIMRLGGFNAIIGNPPYVDAKILGDDIKELLSQKYKTATRRFDLYIPFVEKAFDILQRDGLLGYIMPSMFTRRDYGRDLRSFIIENGSIETVVDFGTNQVFGNAMNYVAIFIIKKSSHPGNISVIKYKRDGIKGIELSQPLIGLEVLGVKNFSIPVQQLRISSEWYLADQNETQFSEKLFSVFPALETILVNASEGIHSGKDDVFFVNTERGQSLGLESPPVFPLAKGKDIHRYEAINPYNLKNRVIYPYDLSTGDVIRADELRELAPNTWNYLESSRPLLGGRPYFERSSKLWYELWCQRVPQLYTNPKIIGPEIANRGEFTLCKEQLFVNNKIKVVIPRQDIGESLEYLLGLLNSSLIIYIHRLIAPPKGGGFFEVKTGIMGKLPIRRINFSDSTDKKRHDDVVALVERMLDLHKRLITANTAQERTVLQRQIEITDRQIDVLVYALYGLTPDEIQIVEHGQQ